MNPYFEHSWSILSSIGIFAALISGFVVISTSLNFLTIVPVVVSIACAVANGLCYYAFYTEYALTGRIVASVIADLMWLIQEVGQSFYAYRILIYALTSRSRFYFLVLFWTLVILTSAIRAAICVNRALDLAHHTETRQRDISLLHVGYFTLVALIEICSSAFLLRILIRARHSSPENSPFRKSFLHLTRSTEIRLMSLCLIGISRAITYSFQTTSQSAETLTGQVDRFVYTLECLFPFVMLVDMLTSKVIRDIEIDMKPIAEHIEIIETGPVPNYSDESCTQYTHRKYATSGLPGQVSCPKHFVTCALNGKENIRTNG